jgi:hypothetical protein
LSSAPVTSVGGGLDPRSNSPEYKATSTGLGERVQLASPEVDLETHITDVVHLIAFEDLHEVVLLGTKRKVPKWADSNSRGRTCGVPWIGVCEKIC